VNDADALIATHDKLATALLLHAASVRQPRAAHLTDDAASPAFEPPYVVKPRFGSWGRDVHRCESRAELHACLLHLLRRPWFRRHGALVQELIAPVGSTCGWLVSGGVVIGAVSASPRRASGARTSPWRNAPKGRADAGRQPRGRSRRRGQRRPVGVDLLPDDDGWRVIEINGARRLHDEARSTVETFTRWPSSRSFPSASLPALPGVALSRCRLRAVLGSDSAAGERPTHG
jgi:glutathione synthase/RimK-type ligase-like ATP-grasp enzyme